MGEAKRKSLNRAKVLERDPLCIYCLSPSTTWDHMPPKAMFKNKDRPGGMEFGCCETCNAGSRTSDAVAAFIAHSTIGDNWRVARSVELFGTIKQHEPDFGTEFFRDGNHKNIHIRQTSGLILPAKKVRLDGPIVNMHLRAFSAKLGMALFREHTGEPMPKNSGVYSNWLGAPLGNQAGKINALLDKLPYFGELKQGTKQSYDQFAYRYLKHEKSFLAATIGFHASLHINVVAIADLTEPELDFSVFDGLELVKHGGLANLVGAANR